MAQLNPLSMDPSVEELNGMADLQGAIDWVGLSAELMTAVRTKIGNLQFFRDVVGCPEAAWHIAAAALAVPVPRDAPAAAPMSPGGAHTAPIPPGQEAPPSPGGSQRWFPRPADPDRPPTVMEIGQVGALLRVCRMRVGRPATAEAPAPMLQQTLLAQLQALTLPLALPQAGTPAVVSGDPRLGARHRHHGAGQPQDQAPGERLSGGGRADR